jgi:hypothetical protein
LSTTAGENSSTPRCPRFSPTCSPAQFSRKLWQGIWPRDCLESYLVIPAALRQILVDELTEDKAPGIKEVETLVSDVIAAMYDATQDRIAARLQDVEWRFNNHSRIDAAAANPIARAATEKIWKQDNNPLVLASGKTILSRVREAIQSKWKVSFGNARIVEAMQPADVHQDIKELLSQAKKHLT